MSFSFGGYELIKKSGLFDGDFYSAANPDVKRLNLDPLLHYIEEGARQARDPNPNFDTRFYLEQCGAAGEMPENPLLHFLTTGVQKGFKPVRPLAEDKPEPPAAPLEAQSFRVELKMESLVLVAQPNANPRLDGAGWLAATQPVSGIDLKLHGRLIGKAALSEVREEISKRLAEDNPLTLAGFTFAAALPGDIAPGSDQPVEFIIRSHSGEAFSHFVPFTIPSAEQLRRLSGISPEISATLDAAMRLHVDQVIVDDQGILRVEGWALAMLHPLTVTVSIDDETLGTAEFGRVREDVAANFPEYPNAHSPGFYFAGDVSGLGAGDRIVKVRCTAMGGMSREVAVPVVLAERALPSGLSERSEVRLHCDELTLTTAGQIHISGWAVCALGVDAIGFYLDGTKIGEAQLGGERPDVGNSFPDISQARRSGFLFDGNLGRGIQGEHLIIMRVRSAGEDAGEMLLPVAAIDTGTVIAQKSGPGNDDLKLVIDMPILVSGAVPTPIRGSLVVGGWALAREGLARIDILIDGAKITQARHGMRREDVKTVYPDRDDAGTSGFTAFLPQGTLPTGKHKIGVQAVDLLGGITEGEFWAEIAEPDEEAAAKSGPWALRRKMSLAEIELQTQVLERLKYWPTFAILMLIEDDEASIRKARETLVSIQRQAYQQWRVGIISANPSAEFRERLLYDFDDIAERVEFLYLGKNQKLSSVIKLRKSSAGPRFFIHLSAGDYLSCDALLELAIASSLDRTADFFYTDERRISPTTYRVEPYFKPDWSPDLLLSTNYVGRLWCASFDLLDRASATLGNLADLGEYDLVLRCTEQAWSIHHLPGLHCETGSREPPAQERLALETAMARRGIEGDVLAGPGPGLYRLKRTHEVAGLVSIVIPTCAGRGLIKICIETLRSMTAYRNFEIICIENISEDQPEWKAWVRENADKTISTAEGFNWSRFNNLAVEQAEGEFLLFLNDDIEMIDPDWLDVLLEHIQRPEIGVVGPLLLYPDHTVQHGGVFLVGTSKARHAFRFAGESEAGYFGHGLIQRNVIGVTGACLLTRRDTFEKLGRFDETHSVVNNDLDYCLRSWASGLQNLYAPNAKLIHHEYASRSEMADTFDEGAFESRWREVFLKGDPYFNPYLSTEADDMSPEPEPTRPLCAGFPVMKRSDIRRILVVKLDHIGDAVTALEPVRRLREHFPGAKISVLTSRSSKPVWAFDPEIERIIEFDFFHARSALGKREVTEDELKELQTLLELYHFDLAIDLRKLPDTRHVLQFTGARYLAGFDFQNRYPWIDFGLDWGGDDQYVPKRRHITDDLLALVDTVAASCERDRRLLADAPRSDPPVPKKLRDVFSRRVVCVHPSSGNETKQWPVDYFALLIDMLADRHDVNIVLIGGPDDNAVAEQILDRVRHGKRIWSLVSKVPLKDLPKLIGNAALFIGNDSGPKHIAAALGVPTVGIHSGVIDAREWGPVGKTAVAIRREMSCSPCYTEAARDCQRGLACLRQLRPIDVYKICQRLMADETDILKHDNIAYAEAG